LWRNVPARESINRSSFHELISRAKVAQAAQHRLEKALPFRVLESIVSFVKLGIAARGRVAQLGERIVRNDEVAGSTPVSSTK
jgi:hypothetical protein